METIATEILVVGGGVGGTCAALQAARRGAQVVLVSEYPWLGGMLTSAGVSVPDGNELEAWQTGLWGAFLRSLCQQQPGGLHHSWVSFFSYHPAIGAAIFTQWVAALPNLTWIVGGAPLAVLREGDRILGVQFAAYEVRAQLTLDGTELGDLLALGEVPHRWGWEAQEQWQEPSAPPQRDLEQDPFYCQYPVQAPTWVVVLQDFGSGESAPSIPAPPTEVPDDRFRQAWQNYGPEQFLNYGRLPGNRFMLNWPIFGNDYDRHVHRLVGTPEQRQQFGQEARWHSQAFAHYLQQQFGNRYGLATGSFPHWDGGGDAYALHPYYRESRRLVGLATVREQDILPLPAGQVAPLPRDPQGQITAIALGNYVNDHHYTQREIALAPKALRWGGRWTGTPFSLPYGCLVPETVDGFLVCEKNISVSHIANGATRLQPIVMALGQAAGMAAALCVEQQCEPRDLPVRSLQLALLQDPHAPAAIVPFFDLLPTDPQWSQVQLDVLDHPDRYPPSGYRGTPALGHTPAFATAEEQTLTGYLYPLAEQQYEFQCSPPVNFPDRLTLVTLNPHIQQTWQTLSAQTTATIGGYWNASGGWFLVSHCLLKPGTH
ncbi:MAG: FAD-dependent oxidoreductase [Prochlorotrichaceae cyanobacterium]|jgi:hypothetical protein